MNYTIELLIIFFVILILTHWFYIKYPEYNYNESILDKLNNNIIQLQNNIIKLEDNNKLLKQELDNKQISNSEFKYNNNIDNLKNDLKYELKNEIKYNNNIDNLKNELKNEIKYELNNNLLLKHNLDYDNNINIPTRGYPTNYQLVGILYNNNIDIAYNLYGRQTYLGSNEYEYYIHAIINNNDIKIPLDIKKEIYDNQEINLNKSIKNNILNNNDNIFKVKLYEYNTPKYIPYIY
jgi:hypothetical protein